MNSIGMMMIPTTGNGMQGGTIYKAGKHDEQQQHLKKELTPTY
jgi:glutamate synthase domain-containing protein 3